MISRKANYVLFGMIVIFSTFSFSQTARLQVIRNSADFAALPYGIIVKFAPNARLQLFHNAAYVNADSVDIYLNGNLLLDKFGFRKATPFINVPARKLLNIGVASGNNTTVNYTLKNFQFTLNTGGIYVTFAKGVLNPADYSTNPDGRSTAFTLFVKDMARESAMDPTQVDFLVLEGATDAPTVDIIAQNLAKLVDNATSSDIT